MENINFSLVWCYVCRNTIPKQNTYSHATKARETIELFISFTHFSRTHYPVCLTSRTHRRPKTYFKFPHLFLLRLRAMHLYWFFLFLTFKEKFLTCHHESSKKWSMTYYQNLMTSFIKPRKMNVKDYGPFPRNWCGDAHLSNT